MEKQEIFSDLVVSKLLHQTYIVSKQYALEEFEALQLPKAHYLVWL